jgi:hypothetical protein
MTSPNLTIVWGANLLRDPQAEENEHSPEEAKVVQNLIDFYTDLFQRTDEELEEERKLLAMLEQYHAIQSDIPHQCGDDRQSQNWDQIL